MVCARCGRGLAGADARDWGSEILCEDCFLETMSPVRPCDPWAVYLARRHSQEEVHLTPDQQLLLDLVKEKGPVSFPDAARVLGVSLEEIEREFATLRHLELLRAVKLEGRICVAPFKGPSPEN